MSEAPGIRLDDFIAETLEQICKGIQRAQEAVTPIGALINAQVGSGAPGHLDNLSGTIVQDVDFDIAVTAAAASKSGGGLTVKALAIGGKFGGGASREDSAVSRVRFTVPVVFPRHYRKRQLPDGE